MIADTFNQNQNSSKISYRDNSALKRIGVEVQYTQEQVDEYVKCSQDPIYFIMKYYKINTLDGGVVPFKPHNFQKDLITLMHENRWVIVKCPRQVGKTTIVMAYLTWVILFIDSQNILIAANKRQVAEDILEKLKLAYENVPMWLQQGVDEWNKGSIKLENGSKIRATSTTSSAARSGSYNMILLDEFAHIEPRMAEEFYTSVYPVITSGKDTKIIMISTPKGMNLFYKFWKDAHPDPETGEKKNNYIPFEVHWRDVPGRTEQWYEDTLRNIGEERFEQEFECAFLGSTNTLISGKKLQQLGYLTKNPIAKRNDIDIHVHPIVEKWDEDTGKLISIEHKYVIIVDTSEGKKLDSSAFTVVDITQVPYIVAAKYKSNIIAPLLYPTVIWSAAKYYNDAFVLIEAMTVGMQIADILHSELEYEHILQVTSGNKKAQTISAGHTKGATMGVKTTSAVKKIGSSNLKTLIESDQLRITDFDIYSELTTFTLNNKGNYEADEGKHDDLVVTLVLFAWLTTQQYFKELVNHDLRKQLRQQLMEYDDEEMLPAPILYSKRERFFDGFDNALWAVVDEDTETRASYINPYSEYFD